VLVPSGGYFAFSYDVPELPAVWQDAPERRPIEIYENGARVPTIGFRRKDGKDGDPAYEHTVQIPVVRNAANLRFLARTDGSATNVLMKLDGGIDLNSQMNPPGSTFFPVGRDQPPGTATETFLGYEQMRFVQRVTEKFAAQVITTPARDIIGSAGAETWECTIGTAGFSRNNGAGVSTDTGTANWAYHEPGAANIDGSTTAQFSPAPASAAGQSIAVWTKVGYKSDAITRAWIYFTTDGLSFPEGSAGLGKKHAGRGLDHRPRRCCGWHRNTQWWRGTLPPLPSDQAALQDRRAREATPRPSSEHRREHHPQAEDGDAFEIAAGSNGRPAPCSPHNNHGERCTGLR
jgi:hypothetical protein